MECLVLFFTALFIWGSDCVVIDARSPECTSEVTELTGDIGVIASPNYPETYPIDANCVWLINGKEDKHVAVSFNETLTVDYDYYATDENCISSYLKIYDGPSTSDRLIFDKPLCGDKIQVRPFVSSGRSVLVVFQSDSSPSYYDPSKFIFTWELVDACADEQFRCHNGQCLPSSVKCNGMEQCTDKSDEWECSYPSSSVCGQPEIAPQFLWHAAGARIVGGNVAVPGSWPWMASVYINNSPQCGGTIITKKWILTAAHCANIYPVDNLKVLVGAQNTGDTSEPDRQLIDVKSKIIHENYEGESALWKGYDIALLELKNDIIFNERKHKICINADEVSQLQADENCVVTGWGRQESGHAVSQSLKQVVVSIFDETFCENYWKNDNDVGAKSYERLFCAGLETGGGDSCQGDSGGPLICHRDQKWIQFGVVSYGEGCAQQNHPGYYTKMSVYSNWIETAIVGVDGACGFAECSIYADCSNTDSGSQCTCHNGFEGDGVTCNDKDECELGEHDCEKENTECVNTVGDFTCDCINGFVLTDQGECENIDECEQESVNCGTNANCVDSVGGYTCECIGGYVKNSDGICVDDDECASCVVAENCPVCRYNSRCVNTVGSFSCPCLTGYTTSANEISCLKNYAQEMRLTESHVFTETLKDKTSQGFIDLADVVVKGVREFYSNQLAIDSVTVLEFKQGSVIAKTSIVFSDPGVTQEAITKAHDSAAPNDVIDNIIDDQCSSEANYCKNEAVCIATNLDNPICICTSFYSGVQCEALSTSSIIVIVLGVVAGLLFVLCIIFLALYINKSRNVQKTTTNGHR